MCFGEVGCGSAKIVDVESRGCDSYGGKSVFSAGLGEKKWQNTCVWRWPGRFVRADKELVGHNNRFEKV